MSNSNFFRTSQEQIGRTLYTVKAMPSERARETAEQKLVRYVKDRIIAEENNAKKPVFIADLTCN